MSEAVTETTATHTYTPKTGTDRLAFVTAATGELSRQWQRPGDAHPEDPHQDASLAPWVLGELPAHPAVPVAHGGSADLMRGGRAGSRATARSRPRRVARRLIAGVAFLAAVTTFTVLAATAFLIPSRPADSVSSPSVQTRRTPLSREPHGRLSADSSASNGRTQDSRQTPPEAVP